MSKLLLPVSSKIGSKMEKITTKAETALFPSPSLISRSDLMIKTIKEQKALFCSESKELSKDEYNRLVSAAKNRGNQRLGLIIQTICGTGIRVSELKFITVEAVRRGEAVVLCKG